VFRFLLAALATLSFALPVFLPNHSSKIDSGIDRMLVADPFSSIGPGGESGNLANF
jgi:hypothetical protein